MSDTDENVEETTDEPTTGTEPTVEELRKQLAAAQETARKADAAAKQNAAAARRLQQLDEASKTEQQRAADAQKAAEDRAAKAERELLRVRVAADKGLTLAQSRRLVGDTEDELRSDADALLDDLKPAAATAATGSRKPTEQLRGGSEPDEPVVEMDSDKLAAQVTAAH